MSIELTIDGKKVTGYPGQTILEVAQNYDIKIPTLCYHPLLPPNGACRICLVDVGRTDRLEAACTIPISPKMNVQTDTQRVRDARKLNLELLLSNHRTDCITCEQDGNCILQDLTYEHNFELKELSFPVQDIGKPIDESNPAIIKDPNLCILCGRCISACNKVRHHNILDYEKRGYDTQIISGLNELMIDSGCVSCGECVQVCPTGALIEKQSRFKGRWKDLTATETTCPFCGVGCKLELYIKDNVIVKVRGKEDAIENNGSLCVKGRFGYDWVNSSERLTKPLIKNEDGFKETTWDEALNYIASTLKTIIHNYGGDSIMGLASAKCTNEENYLFQKFMRACIGTNNVDHCARLCHAPTVAGLVKAFGSGAMTNSIQEILETKCILVTGSNTTENHPVIAKYIRQAIVNNGAQLIVADPREIDLVNNADIWLRQRNGTDVALINSIMNVIISENLHDKEFIRNRTENFNELLNTVKKYSPEKAEKITGVPADQIRKAALLLGKAERASIIFSMGITQHITGTDNVLSIANLAMLTGNVGKFGTGVNPLRGQNNVQGACDMGALPDVFSGYQLVNELESKQKFEQSWGVELNDQKGLTLIEAMNSAIKGGIKAMYIMGENPMVSDPDLNHVEKALESLEFLVVQDIFLSETAHYADVILPACCFAEKNGTFTNTARRIQLVNQALDAPGVALPDWKIICQISSRLGYPMKYENSSQIMDEIASLTPIYGGIKYDRLTGSSLQWPCPNHDHPGTQYLHKNNFSRGLGRFHEVEFIPPDEQPDEEYPYILTTGRILEHFHTGTMTRKSLVLDSLVSECPIEISPKDAKNLSIRDGDKVSVTSRRGTITGKAKVTKRSAIGMIFIPFHFVETAVNILTNSALDPKSKIPELKVCAVKIDKIKN